MIESLGAWVLVDIGKNALKCEGGPRKHACASDIILSVECTLAP